MPDSFFQSDKKRKRTRPNDSRPARNSGGGGERGDRERSGGRGNSGSGSGRDRNGGSGGSSSKSFYRPSMYGKGSRTSSAQDKDENLSSESEAEGPGARGRGGDIDDMDLRAGRGEEDDYMSDEGALDEHETAAEKRVRLARGYLEKVRKEVEDANQDMDYDAAEIDREIIASRLQKDVAESEGKIHTFLSPLLFPSSPSSSASSSAFRARLLSIPSHAPTSVALTPGDIYLSTKRGTVFRYSLASLRKVGSPFGQNMPAKVKAPSSGANGKGKGKGKGTAKGNAKVGANGWDEKPQGHKGEILAIAASEDGQYVVTGGRDRLVGVWRADGAGGQVEWVAGIRGHKDAVTGIAIPPLNNPSHHILTASLSRHLALQSLSTLSTIDTFFGHQDSIASVSAIKPTAAATAGSRDRTCRWWKVEEEVQLVLRGGGRSFWMGDNRGGEKVGGAVEGEKEEATGGEKEKEAGDAGEKERVIPGAEEEKPKRRVRRGGKEYVEGSIDVVCVLDDQRFISGGDSGTISLWNTGKKKPIFSITFAHGVEVAPASTSTSTPTTDPAGGQAEQGNKYIGMNSSAPTENGEVPRWITSLAALRGTDLFASGSWDGQIRIWALDPAFRSFALVSTIPCMGFVNGLQMLSVQSAKVDMAAFGSPSPSSSSPSTVAAAAAAAAHIDSQTVDQGDAAETEAEGAQKADGQNHANGKAHRSDSSIKGQTIVLAAAVSQEPRLGRWMRIKEGVRNGLLVAALPL